MPGIIAGILLSFFAIIGITETYRSIKHYMLAPTQGRAVFTLSCKGHDEQIEYHVRSLANQANDMRFHGAPLIVIIDAGMDEETRNICEKLTKDLNGVTVCKNTDLSHLFCEELQN